MASVTLKLSSKTNKDTGKAEVLLRYRNTRAVALRGHSHTFLNEAGWKENLDGVKIPIVTAYECGAYVGEMHWNK